MRIPRSAQRRSIRLSREVVLSISTALALRTSDIFFSRASKGKTEDVRVRAMLIIALTAAHGDRSERLIKAACRRICLVNLKKKPLRSRLSQRGDGSGEKGAPKTLAAVARIHGKRQDLGLVAGASDNEESLHRLFGRGRDDERKATR